MGKTEKFNKMIEAFECDFSLAVNGENSLSELIKKIEDKDARLLADVDLLKELSFLLRHGQAEIHLVDEKSERLTDKNKISYERKNTHITSQQLLDKLGIYEDAEEQGLLLRLPCPIGTTVFELEEEQCEGDFYNCHHNCEDCQCYSGGKSIIEAEFDFDMLNVIGKYVFLTREEAEKALTDMGV